METATPSRTFQPATDIFETKDAITLLVDMPGVGEADLDLTVEKNVLRIHGKVKATEPSSDEGDLKLAYAEFESGDFERSFALSSAIDRENIEAVLRDGVLQLTLKRVKPQEPQKIQVRVEH